MAKPTKENDEKAEPAEAFAAIYKNLETGKVWISVGTLRTTKEQVEQYHNEMEQRIPMWFKANKLLRIGKVFVSE
jgi:hypothetical protein